MIPISNRFALPLLILLLAAAVPVWMNSGSDRYRDDCADPLAFEQMRDIPHIRGVSQYPEQLNSSRIEWTQGYLVEPDESDTLFGVRVVRTFDPYDMLVKPKRILQQPFLPDIEEVKTMSTPRGEMSVHFGFKVAGRYSEGVAYAFLYRDEPVRSVFWTLLRSAFRPFLGPTRPIATVLLYRAPGVRQPDEMVSDGLESMRTVADHYWATCYPDA